MTPKTWKTSTGKRCRELELAHYTSKVGFSSSCFPGLFQPQVINWNKVSRRRFALLQVVFFHTIPQSILAPSPPVSTGLFELLTDKQENKETAFLQLTFFFSHSPYITEFHFNNPSSSFSSFLFIPGSTWKQEFHCTGFPPPFPVSTMEFCNIWCCVSDFATPAFALIKITQFLALLPPGGVDVTGILAWPLQVLPSQVPWFDFSSLEGL